MPVIPGASLTFDQLAGRAAADPLAAGGAGAADCSVRVVRIPPGPRTPHRHPDTPEIVYVAEGSGTAWESGTSTPITAGDLLAIPAGTPHATTATTLLTLICFFPTPTPTTEELPAPLREPKPRCPQATPRHRRARSPRSARMRLTARPCPLSASVASSRRERDGGGEHSRTG